ncbi:MAG: hypothetical protein PHP31_07650 [Lentimicrobiaceae bacterium]|nr:hypothetical protein [Lentimicrobiaceae bacterium]
MSETNKKLNMRPMSIRIYDDTRELYDELRNERTHDNFLSALLELYQNPKEKEVPIQADKDKINELTETVIDLKNENSLLLDEISNLKQESSTNAETYTNTLKSKVLFELSDDEFKLMELIKKQVKKDRNVDISTEIALYLAIRDGYLMR